jgi:hypothetical protein
VILGFRQFGCVLASKAAPMPRKQSNTAVAEALAPVCAASFFAQADAPAKLADLKKTSLRPFPA